MGQIIIAISVILLFACAGNTEKQLSKEEVSKIEIKALPEQDSLVKKDNLEIHYLTQDDTLRIKVVIDGIAFELPNTFFGDYPENLVPKLYSNKDNIAIFVFSSGDYIHANVLTKKANAIESLYIDDFISADLENNRLLSFNEEEQPRTELIYLDLKTMTSKRFDYSKNNPMSKILDVHFKENGFILKYENESIAFGK